MPDIQEMNPGLGFCQERQVGEGSFGRVVEGEERDGNSNKRDVGEPGVKTSALYKEWGPFKRGPRTKGCRALLRD